MQEFEITSRFRLWFIAFGEAWLSGLWKPREFAGDHWEFERATIEIELTGMQEFEITSRFRLWFIAFEEAWLIGIVKTLRVCRRPLGIWKSDYWNWTYVDARVWNHFPIPFVIYALRKLDLSDCENLESLPETIGNLKEQLLVLNLRGCKSLKSLPDSVCDLLHLEKLDLWRLWKPWEFAGDHWEFERATIGIELMGM